MGYEVNDSEVKVSFEKETAYFTAVREDIIRVYVPFFDETCKSKAIEENPCVPVTFTVEKDGEAVVIRTDKILVKIQDDFYDGYWLKAVGCWLKSFVSISQRTCFVFWQGSF